MARLSWEPVAVNRPMLSWRARSDSRVSSSRPRPRPCQSSTMVTPISAARGVPGWRTEGGVPAPGPAGGVRADVGGDAPAAPVGRVQRTERLVVTVVDVGEEAQLGIGQRGLGA